MMSQPLPKPGMHPVTDQAISNITTMIHSQSERGKRKYGSELMTFNGRNAGRDAYEELADLTMYLQQLCMERAWLADENLKLQESLVDTQRQLALACKRIADQQALIGEMATRNAELLREKLQCMEQPAVCVVANNGTVLRD